MSNISNSNKSSLGPIIIIGILFFVFGFITWLNGILIPYLKTACELTTFASFLVAFAFYISYFVMALPSSWVLEKTGFKNGMALGLLVMAFGSLLFIPAAYTRSYPLFLVGLFIQGTGLSVLQTASNPYITVLGPIESAAKRISIMGICNKVAGAISPLVLGAIVMSGADKLNEKLLVVDEIQKALLLDEMAQKVILPYVVMAIVLVLLVVLIRMSSLPKIKDEEETYEESGKSRSSIFHFPYLLLGVISLFLYVGVEVIAGDSIIAYGLSLDLNPVNISIAGWNINLTSPLNFTTYTLIGMLVGYVFGIAAIPKFISQERALALFSVMGVGFSILVILTSGFTSVLFVALLGVANAIMWPAIWPLSIGGLGKFTKIGSAMLIMAIAGGAIYPLLYGKMSEFGSMQSAYWVMIPAYVFILFFAVWGHKIGKVKN